ncbi:MAG: type IV pilus twitching motility protein PilT [Candidatus Tectimicrobiota bacterium]
MQPPGPAVQRLQQLLGLCVQQEASDLHLVPDSAPYLRVHGILAPVPGQAALSQAEISALVEALLGDVERDALLHSGALDGAMTATDGTRFRFNVFRRQGSLAIALRRLEERFHSLAELGLPDMLYQLCTLADGLVLVAGPTGAGKSTTLATLLDRINQTRRCHIVTIEDPIEYLHRPALSLVNQRQVGSDTRSFHEALVAAMRQDPDVILVGEIRDLATMRTAIIAAETGHLVLTTVHAGDCVGAIERLTSVFPADEQDGIRRQLSLVLRAVVTQHLLLADGSAGRGSAPAAAAAGTAAPLRRRVVASEVLMVTPAVAHLIATARSAQIYSAMETGGGLGMQTLEDNLAHLVLQGHIAESTAMAMARNPAVMRDRLALLQKRRGPVSGGGRR